MSEELADHQRQIREHCDQVNAEHEPKLFLQITESQARKIAACDQDAIRDVLVECAKFMLDCEWGGLEKYVGDPVAAPKKARTRA